MSGTEQVSTSSTSENPTSSTSEASTASTTEAPTEPTPVAALQALALAHRGQSVFGPVTAQVPSGDLTVVHGAAGSGRSSLLLALTGRMRGITGGLTVAGVDGVSHPRRVRPLTSIARIGSFVTLEPQLNVGESVTERCLTEAIPVRDGMVRLEALADTIGRRPEAHDLVGDLSPLDAALFSVTLAMLRPARLVVIDDCDHDLDTDGQRELYATLRRLTATGTAIVASTCDATPIPTDTTTITLPQES